MHADVLLKYIINIHHTYFFAYSSIFTALRFPIALQALFRLHAVAAWRQLFREKYLRYKDNCCWRRKAPAFAAWRRFVAFQQAMTRATAALQVASRAAGTQDMLHAWHAWAQEHR